MPDDVLLGNGQPLSISNDEEGNTEKFSENTTPRKRGRPRRFDNAPGFFTQTSAKQFPHVQSARGHVNMHYLSLALTVLTETDHPDRRRYDWLCPDGALLWLHPMGASLPHLRPRIKTTILTELGRVGMELGEEHMRNAALHLCETKPKTQDAVRSLRAWRLDQEGKMGTAAALEVVIARAVDDYLTRYPATPPGVVSDTLRGYADLVDWIEEERRTAEEESVHG
jgi:hypothetical protein